MSATSIARESGPRPGGTQSIQRVVAILRCLSAQGRAGTRLNDVAEATNLEVPTAHRMLKCLVAERAVTFDAESRRYALGMLMFELGLAATPTFDLRRLCQPSIVRLAERTGDTVIVSVRSEFDTVCVSRQEGSYPVKAFTVDIGSRRPLGIGAGSLALLSALSDDEIDAVLEANATAPSRYGSLGAQRFREMTRATRKRGYAVRDVDIPHVPDVRAMGVAVLDPSGRPVAALSVVTIKRRLPKERQREVYPLLAREADIVRAAMQEA